MVAGAGFKTFGVGDVLTASDVNTYLMQQAVMNFADSGARGSAIGTAALSEGMVSYLQDTNAVEVYDGSAWTAVGASPAILQVVSTTKTDTFSTTSTSYVDVTGLTVTITPTSATSKVFVVGTLQWSVSPTDPGYNFAALARDGTLIGVGAADGSRTRASSSLIHRSGRDETPSILNTGAASVFDSPATTSAVTYSWQVLRDATYGGTVYVNKTHSDGDNTWVGRGASSITVMEVAA